MGPGAAATSYSPGHAWVPASSGLLRGAPESARRGVLPALQTPATSHTCLTRRAPGGPVPLRKPLDQGPGPRTNRAAIRERLPGGVSDGPRIRRRVGHLVFEQRSGPPVAEGGPHVPHEDLTSDRCVRGSSPVLELGPRSQDGGITPSGYQDADTTCLFGGGGGGEGTVPRTAVFAPCS